jgi:macrolide transport system ATP-binding/permease protein
MWRKRKDSDFQAEIDAHLQLEAEQLRADGFSGAEADAAARRMFGNRTVAQERFYESGRWMLWDHLLRDLRFALRVLTKDPRFSILAILGLALGIGVSTAIFTLIDASVQGGEVRQDPNSYVGITLVINGHVHGDFSYPEYCYYRDRSNSFRAVTAGSGREKFLMGLLSGSEAEEVQGRFAAANFLSATGLQPAMGRSFAAAEEEGAAPVRSSTTASGQGDLGPIRA